MRTRGGVIGDQIRGGGGSILVDALRESRVPLFGYALSQSFEVAEVRRNDRILVVQQSSQLPARQLAADVGARAAQDLGLRSRKIALDGISPIVGHQSRLAANIHGYGAVRLLQAGEVHQLR